MPDIIKPPALRRKECIDKICAAINEMSLPAFVTVDILEKVLSEARRLADEEYKRETDEYQKQLNAAKDKDE